MAHHSRRVYLVLMRHDDPREAVFLAKADWVHDTRGWPDPTTPPFERTLSRDDFLRSWFELADVQTERMSESTFERFVSKMTSTIVKVEPRTGVRTLRSDAEIAAIVKSRRARGKLGHGDVRAGRAEWVRTAPAGENPPRPHHYESPTTASVAAHRAKYTLETVTAWEVARRGARNLPALKAGQHARGALAHSGSRVSSLSASLTASRRPSLPPSAAPSQPSSRAASRPASAPRRSSAAASLAGRPTASS